MSTDSVDDIHALEDRVSYLEGFCERLVAFLEHEDRRLPFVTKQLGQEGNALFAELHAIARGAGECARASCEWDEDFQIYLCGEYCGCIGTHDHPEHGLDDEDLEILHDDAFKAAYETPPEERDAFKQSMAEDYYGVLVRAGVES